MATTYKNKPVHTWADGFGNWHARVDFPSTGYGNTGELALERHWDSIRAAARRAIRAELIGSAPRDAELAPVRIEVEDAGIHPSSNIWYSATFRELVRGE